MNKIYFAKINTNAKIPTKRQEDGCYDLYACIDKSITIYPHTTELIPTGICSAFSSKYRIGFRERGSNTKFGGIVMAGQIDSGFRGEWFVAIHNASNSPTTIYPYSKAICQFAIEEVPEVEICETDIDTINTFESERGEGMLGSSGK